jgi:hypothetical protein
VADLSIKGIPDKEYGRLKIEAIKAGVKFREFVLGRLGLPIKPEKKGK